MHSSTAKDTDLSELKEYLEGGQVLFKQLEGIWYIQNLSQKMKTYLSDIWKSQKYSDKKPAFARGSKNRKISK